MMQSFFDLTLLDSMLVQAALRSAVLAAAVGAGLWLFRVRNPHHQLAAWSAVLLISVLMPVLMRWMVVSVPAAPGRAEIMPVGAALSTPTSSMVEPSELILAPTVFPTMDADAATGIDWMAVIGGVYIGVVAILILRLAIGLALTTRLRRGAARVYALWTGDSDVRVTGAITAPVTVGETILLPLEHEMWPSEKRRAVLLHERAHVARGDFYVQVLAAAYRAVFWFSPVAWWLHEKLAEVAEHASDAEAAAQLDERIDYAAVLLEFAHEPRTTRFRVAPIAVAMARPAAMRERIERVLADNGALSTVRQGMRLAVAGIVVACGLAAAVSFVETPARAAAGIETAPLVPPVQSREPAPPVPLVRPAEPAPAPLPAAASPQSDAARHVHIPPLHAEIAEHDFPGVHIPPIHVDAPDIDAAIDMAEIRRGIAEARIEARQEAAVQRAEAARERRAQMAAASPSGPTVRETRNVEAFTGVSFGGSGKVFITVGEKPSVVLEGDARVLSRFRTEVTDGMLRIRQRDGDGDFGHRSEVTAYITVPVLTLARVSGSGDLKVTGLDGGDTSLSISGSGSVEADGKLAQLQLSISGSGSAAMAGLVVDDANIAISGSGSAVVDVREDLNVRVSGSGNVRYLGQPKDINTSISGSGSVRRRDT